MPAVDVESTAAELSQAMGLLLRRVRALSAPGDLSLTEAAVLKSLEKDGAASSADLARAQGMKPQSMGTIVSDLRGRGLLFRQADPTDGRRILVALTPKGTELLSEHRSARRAWLAQAIGRLDPADQDVLHEAARVIRLLCGP